MKSHLVWLLIGEKCAQIKHCLWVKTALNKYVGGFWRERITGDGLFQWWKRYYGFKLLCFLTKSNGLKLKHLNDGFSCKHAAFGFTRRSLIDGLEWCGLLVNGFYQLFGLSFWRHPFTAEDPSLSKWCNATFLQIWWRNKLIYILHGLRLSTFSANFHFWVNYSFKHMLWFWGSVICYAKILCLSFGVAWNCTQHNSIRQRVCPFETVHIFLPQSRFFFFSQFHLLLIMTLKWHTSPFNARVSSRIEV